MTSASLPTRIPESLVVANAKGGVGKTTIAANLALHYAAAGLRVVAVDLDPQANLAVEFGIRHHDEGRSLAEAATGEALAPELLGTGRRGLSYIASGRHLEKMAWEVSIAGRGDRTAVARGLRRALETVLQPNTVVVMDTPPVLGSPLADAAMLLGEWMIIPTKKDLSSQSGVTKLFERVLELSKLTGDIIVPVGVVLFDMDRRASRINRETREQIEAKLGGAFPVFDSMIRHADKAQQQAKAAGLIASEYAELAESTPVMPFWEARERGLEDQTTFASNAGDLASDYAALMDEIDNQISQLRRSKTPAQRVS